MARKSDKTPRDDETIEALELLGDAAPPRASDGGPDEPVLPARDDTEPIPLAPLDPPPPPPPPQQMGTGQSAAAQPPGDVTPHYRCLACGYPLMTPGHFVCSECGAANDPDALESWFDGDERSRFEHVIWLVAAVLFLKLLVLPELLWVSSLGTAIIALWANYHALQHKQDTLGGYYAMGGALAGGAMLLAFWLPSTLPFYTLELIAGTLLLLAMLFDRESGAVARFTFGGRYGQWLLFAIPPLAIACYVTHHAVIMPLVNTALTVPEWIEVYSPTLFVVPYLATCALWLFVWLTLRKVRRTYW